MRKAKNSSVDEGEAQKRTLLNVAKDTICCAQSTVLVIGGILGMMQLLLTVQHEKHGTNTCVRNIMDRNFKLTKQNNWKLLFR